MAGIIPGLDPGPLSVAMPSMAAMASAMPDLKPKPQGGMFGGGKFGLKEALAFGLAGLVARRNPALLQGLMQAAMLRQKQNADEQQYQRERQDKFADFRQQYDYKIAHPEPADYGEFERALIASGVQPGTPQWQQAMKTRASNMLDPITMTPMGPMTRSQLMAGQGGQSAPQGVTFTPIGGAGGNASGGFPY